MKKTFKDYILLNEEVKLSKIVKKVKFDNYEILIGKNAKMNDILTFEIANDDDIWLHVKGIPGSHVIIKTNDNNPPDIDMIKNAANYAIINSRSDNKHGTVVWTKRKNVIKQSHFNDGQVKVNYEKSKFITV